MARRKNKNINDAAQNQKENVKPSGSSPSLAPSTKRKATDGLSTDVSEPFAKRSKNLQAGDVQNDHVEPSTAGVLNKRAYEAEESDCDAQLSVTKKAKIEPQVEGNHAVPETQPRGDHSSKSAPDIEKSETFLLQLPLEVQSLAHRYDFTPMSIQSSAKMEPKIRIILERIRQTDQPKSTQKPGVVILHAKADVASKMVGIVEIAKREIQNGGSTWYQYCRLEGQLLPLKNGAPAQRNGGGKTIAEWEHEQAKLADTTAQTEPADADGTKSDEDQAMEDENEGEDEDGPVPPETTAAIANTTTKETNTIREIPVLFIYLATVPLPALRQAYGYVGQIG